ncbi:MAG: hypothetical protein ABSD44_13635 [Terracidiphilus sp.]
MINKSTYLGIPLRRRKNRRLLVGGYWAVVLLFLEFIYCSPVLQILLLGRFPGNGWLGFLSIMLTGPLFGYLTTCLGGVSGNGLISDWDGPFDERDIRLRNAAHFEAYRIFRVIIVIIVPLTMVVVIVFGTFWSHYQRLSVPLLSLLWFLVFSLPQSLILWFEPDMEEPQ